MRSWLTLALCLLTTRALAQDPLADAGPALQQPYQAATWSDPYAASIVHLRTQRPSRFWPIALMAAGGLAMGVGITSVAYPDASLTRPEGVLVLAAGAAGLGTGIWLHRRGNQRRAQLDAQIRQLQVARAINAAPLARTPTPLAPPPRQEPAQVASTPAPIPPDSGPLALILSGSTIGAVSMVWLYIVGTDVIDGSTLPPAIGLAVGGAMAITGIVLLDQLRRKQRGRVDLSLAPLLIRW